MKLHRNIASGIIAGLTDILIHQKQADITVERLLRSNKSWGARDRKNIAENIYNITRYMRLYSWCCNIAADTDAGLWKLLGARLLLQGIALPEWNEFAGLDETEIRQRYDEGQQIAKIRESIPDWLDEWGEADYGAEWDNEIAALNQEAKLSIRVNTLKSSLAAVKHFLQEQGIGFTETDMSADALVLEGRKNLSSTAAYREGWFEIQDVSSQYVAPFVLAEPEMRVIDGCAGAGGKTLHLACLMKNKGEIIALDVNEHKLQELEKRAAKAGCTIVKTLQAEENNAHLNKNYFEWADRILLDVPCSGTGVLRRKPDAKWNLSPEFISGIITKQALLLTDYAPLLKPGAKLIYSTCSILSSENEKQIEYFIHKMNGVFELEEERKISPSQSGFDGFYMARLRKR